MKGLGNITNLIISIYYSKVSFDLCLYNSEYSYTVPVPCYGVHTKLIPCSGVLTKHTCICEGRAYLDIVLIEYSVIVYWYLAMVFIQNTHEHINA